MSNNLLAVVVLAAGQGTRMKSKLPKVLHKMCGKTMLGFALENAKKVDPKYTITVVRHEREQIVSYLENEYPDVKIVDQDEIPGTGRAVECAIESIKEEKGTVIVTCADVPMLEFDTIQNLVKYHESNEALVTVLTTELENPTGYGRIVTQDSTFKEIVEEKDACQNIKKIKQINGGIYAFEISFLKETIKTLDRNNSQNEIYLTDLVKKAYEKGNKAFTYNISDYEQIQGCNDRVQLADLRSKMNKRICETWMREGVTIFDPNTTWIDAEVTIESDVTIMPNTILEGTTHISEGTIIGPDTNLKNVKVGKNAKVERTQGSDSTLGDETNIGPFAYIRPGTNLGNNGKIGGFVETKNSTIGQGSKVPHLSYVGDATIGKFTNIGAASIFVNYDGVEKHQTTIGDYCRLGSDNMYVAPVLVGDGVYTGAGTVVRKDIPSGALSVNDTDQRIIEGWVEKKRPGTPAAQAVKNKNNKNNQH
ncbi:bifunctional UDP-N-acetylglucosamine diphosphorylase/glucosamine-1-phosphate N-acetyltransferase GlmU [Actinomyces sp. zg-332]|uniref:bifunctional UDP-N-acetylglucosamine diphosphorylase/glucosamine-1-phosphate N-acetyltransferase GlmU n=1 Tax=Actinomyces sp. zg-332 TaxID=2708340 RepID=UPI00141FCD31|nr:bifunctional UDP-N-acetylglucosamine diphosphorylase/glucosamine-1-phosphate N-acetyltransferase GlmU [Actinomyces sp. zg-332]QPK94295.1 bifunctional UDP-N-acetylglucosamine diphosphorylase/glucosamine-1-phosphate N-acetyltransferase GlmU [Actinomyces sp. zg-332]